MFKRVLVPLDGSARAERGLVVAKRIARATRGSIVLVRVVDPVSVLWPVSQAPLIETQLESAAAYLTGLLSTDEQPNQESGEPPIPADVLTLRGNAASNILSAIDESGADSVVICSHGQSAETRWRVGGVSAKIARHAKIPVLILKEGGSAPGGPHPDATEPLRVVVPLDGSTHATTALAPAAFLLAKMARGGPSVLHLLHIIPAEVQMLSADDRKRELVRRAGEYLQEMAQKLKDGLIEPSLAHLAFDVTWSVVLDSDVANAIIRVAEHGETQEGTGSLPRADGIAMATHGMSGIRRWAMGSVTERVMHGTKLPLLITRPVWSEESATSETPNERI